MRQDRRRFLERMVALAAGLLVLKVTASIIANYHFYFPPDFTSDFLRGREAHFRGAYRWAFYTHIVSGPVALVVGLFLISDVSRRRDATWHRRLGRIQVGCIVLLVTPSGLWMAAYAAAGRVAGVGLAVLAIATASCAALGARAAMTKQFSDHRRWMWRCYLLLCSAVVLRLIGGLATVMGVTASWVDPIANWLSWLVPLAAFECREAWRGGQLPSTSISRPHAIVAENPRQRSAS